MDRRTTIKWVLAASAAWPLAARSADRAAAPGAPRGDAADPDLVATYRPGEVWPLTLTSGQRHLAGLLADIILPADERSPAASAVGVVEFIDEWLSAPYPDYRSDRAIVLGGFDWLDAEAGRRFGRAFSDLTAAERDGICADICDESQAPPERKTAARFFACFRDLAAGGFYSTPVGRADLGYIGNVPLTQFDGPPSALLAKLNLP